MPVSTAWAYAVVPRCIQNFGAMNRRTDISIGLLWHSASAGNLGVGALTVGNLIAARRAAAACGLTPRFTIFEMVGDLATAYVDEPDVETFQISGRALISPSGYWKRLGNMDCILDIGAGDSFTDIYSPKRFLYLWLTKELSYLRKVPLILSPQTIGPFTKQPFRALAAHAMRRAHAVIARDPASFDAIGDLSPKARALQSVDVAFLLPFERPAKCAAGDLDVGINVSGLLFNGGYSESNEFGLQVEYPLLMRGLISELTSRKGVKVHLICHVNSDRLVMDDDRRVANLLHQEFSNTSIAPEFKSPVEAKSYISGLDFLVAGRMHACIAAYSAGVPVVPIAYSRKFSGLFQGVLKYPYGVPVTGFSTAAALAYVLKCLDERAELAAAVQDGQAIVDTALKVYDLELESLFRSVV